MQTAALAGGFADPPRDAAHAFRAIMDAMARPGDIKAITGTQAPAPLSQAAGTVLATLADGDTPVHLAGALDTSTVHQWLAFHTGARRTTRQAAHFAVGRWEDLLPLADYAFGTPEYPDQSATLIVECDRLAPEGANLIGPGIRDRAQLSLPATLPEHRAALPRFPLGLDFIFTCGDRLAALPRSTVVS